MAHRRRLQVGEWVRHLFYGHIGAVTPMEDEDGEYYSVNWLNTKSSPPAISSLYSYVDDDIGILIERYCPTEEELTTWFVVRLSK